MLYPIDNIKGLATDVNNIKQSEFSCIESNNIRKNKIGSLVKLNALAQKLNIVFTGDIIDAYHIKSRDEIFIIEEAKFSRINNVSTAPEWESISAFPSGVIEYSSDTALSFVL